VKEFENPSAFDKLRGKNVVAPFPRHGVLLPIVLVLSQYLVLIALRQLGDSGRKQQQLKLF